ncbi:MAG: exodeoxyribonuclease VII large subunit [Prevotella sp.]|nr:exodeoxyribonuclease VII large subunit [Prevotella sp.]
MNKQRFSLLQLNSIVREVIDTCLNDHYWVEAEIGQIGENRGHCYMEFIQRDEGMNTPVARASAKCWRTQWGAIRPYFEHTTGQTLKAGMKILALVHPDFHENYGFAWIVDDIDPQYTLGDMARKRMEIIERLKRQGVFDLNRQLSLPLFCQRIAVISSSTAAGYGDFSKQLHDNPRHFIFHATLFEATMQGETIERSVIEALNAIYSRIDDFDCVVIIRGGGATSDMAGFDSLALAENVANFPLPVITGIGHERDECVLDMISHTRVKTPTAAAALLIDRLSGVADRIDNAAERINNYMSRRMDTERLRLANAAERIPILFSLVRSRQENRLESISTSISHAIASHLDRQRHRIDLIAQRTQSLDPDILLKRGYSITLVNGKTLRSPSQVKHGDIITTRLANGSVTSVITDSSSQTIHPSEKD